MERRIKSEEGRQMGTKEGIQLGTYKIKGHLRGCTET